MVHYFNFLGIFEYASAPASLIISYMVAALMVAAAALLGGWLAVRFVVGWTTRR